MSAKSPPPRFPPPSGLELPPLRERLTQRRIQAYAEASGDHNPIHLDAAFAQAAGLPSTIAHGLLTLGAAAAQVELWAGEAAYAARVSCRFSAPVPSGQTVTGTARVAQADATTATVELELVNEAGERVLSKASVELRSVESPSR